MKPFITDALIDGKYILPFQIEGVDRKAFTNVIQGRSILGYSFPKGQKLKATWDFCLIIDNNISICFSSATTGIGGWEEMGSLNIRVCATSGTNASRNTEIYIQTISH